MVPQLLLLCGVLSGRQDRVEDIFGVCVSQVLRIYLNVLHGGDLTFACFLPELETRTGFEYLTRLCGWLKLVGPWLVDICNLSI